MLPSRVGSEFVSHNSAVEFSKKIRGDRPLESPNLPSKDAGTIYEQTFDAVQIDATKGMKVAMVARTLLPSGIYAYEVSGRSDD